MSYTEEVCYGTHQVEPRGADIATREMDRLFEHFFERGLWPWATGA